MSHDPLLDLDDSETRAADDTVAMELAPVDASGDEKSAESTLQQTADVEPELSAAVGHSDSLTLTLPASMSVADVGELHSEMMRYLEQQAPVVLDGSGVEGIEGAGVQLLASFVKTAIDKQIPVSWLQSSDPLRAAAEQMGLTSMLLLDASAA